MYNVYVYLLTLRVLIFAENVLTRLCRLFYFVKNNKFINFIFKNRNHKVVENWIKNLTVWKFDSCGRTCNIFKLRHSI